MKSLQKQLCGIAVLIFGLIVTVIGTGFGNVLSLAGWKAVHLQKRNVFVAKTADFL